MSMDEISIVRWFMFLVHGIMNAYSTIVMVNFKLNITVSAKKQYVL